MKDLHLKFRMDTGAQAMMLIPTDDGTEIVVPTDEYLEWLEDLALKQINQTKAQTDAAKVMAKIGNIKMCFESLKSNINSIDASDVEEYEITQISDDCDDLESAIYD